MDWTHRIVVAFMTQGVWPLVECMCSVLTVCKSGVRDRIMQHLNQEADLEESFIDSTAIRVHQHAAGDLKKARRFWAALVAAGGVRAT